MFCCLTHVYCFFEGNRPLWCCEALFVGIIKVGAQTVYFRFGVLSFN
ncbi:hypothetical protein PEPS_20790 [Persicobacter psychrovividus]|uniref:Uncharacterized protein n=1 Tax=Persicobacter psychrovividus TaxID=387638 RepID=A0ABM7VFQ0_9BACT|nr:hypothetical protein PEPS_20790 [Persicobacter psychrovividus]